MGKLVFLISIICSIPAILALNFHSDISLTITYSFNCIPQAKYEEEPIDNATFFVFFTALDLI